MGVACCAARSKPQHNIVSLVSNRQIQMQNQNPVYHHGLSHQACGYGFTSHGSSFADLTNRYQNRQKEEQGELYEQIQELYLKIRKSYKEHDIDSCMPLIESIKKLSKKVDYSCLDVSVQEQKEMKKFIQNIEERYKQMLTFLNKMEAEGWEKQGQKDGIKIFSKRQNGTVGMLMQGQIEVPVQIFLTIMATTDLYNKLLSAVKLSRQEKYIDRNHKIGYCLFDLPLLSCREAVFEGIGFNRLKHNNTLFMYSQSIHNRPDLCEKIDFTPKLNKQYVQINFEYLMVKYIPTGYRKGKATIALNIDMKLNFVPLGLMEMACKKICFDFFEVVMRASSRYPGSEWEEKVKKNPDTYHFFENIINEHYARHDIK